MRDLTNCLMCVYASFAVAVTSKQQISLQTEKHHKFSC